MELSLEMLDFFPKVDIKLENLINILFNTGREQMIGTIDDEIVNSYRKKVFITPRGSVRHYLVGKKQAKSADEAAVLLQYGKFEKIELRDHIKNNPELFYFIPISKGSDVRYTVSKYSPFFLDYFNPMAKDIQVIYTFKIMFVRVKEKGKVKAYYFDLGTNGLSMRSIVRDYCKAPNAKDNPYLTRYLGTLKNKFPIQFGLKKADFRACKDIINVMRFFQTSLFEYVLYNDYDVSKKDITTLKMYAVDVAIHYIGVDLKSFCESQGITIEEFTKVAKQQEKELITQSGIRLDIDSLIKMLDIEHEFKKASFKKSELMKEVSFEEIPD